MIMIIILLGACVSDVSVLNVPSVCFGFSRRNRGL